MKLRDAGDPVKLASAYRDQGADEIVFLDISATTSKRKTLGRLVRNVASGLDIPFTVGGGIKDEDDVRTVLRNGADKVTINTAALSRPRLIRELAEVYGSQCIVVAIDAQRKYEDRYMVYSHSGLRETRWEAADWARRAEQLGAGELLVTSIDNDGTKRGYDLELLRQITSRVGISVIASGGCGSAEHIYEVFRKTECDAALAASVFHYGELSVKEVKEYLASREVLVRL
jgi:cyclase